MMYIYENGSNTEGGVGRSRGVSNFRHMQQYADMRLHINIQIYASMRNKNIAEVISILVRYHVEIINDLEQNTY